MSEAEKVKPIVVKENDRLHDIDHNGVPKGAVIGKDGNVYYVDVNGDESHKPGIWKHDPKSGETSIIESPSNKNGDLNHTTAIGQNQDGSMIVARMDGIHAFDPTAEKGKEFTHLADIPGISEKWRNGEEVTKRPNNGAMIPMHDGKTRFVVGTMNLDGKDMKGDNNLLALEQRSNGTFVMEKIRGDVPPLVTANGLSGYTDGDKTIMTVSDTKAPNAILYKAEYLPTANRFKNAETLVDFKEGKEKATNGRPDGASPVTYNGKSAVAVTAFESNEVHIYPTDKGGNLTKDDMITRIVLPEGSTKPTMPTFHKEGDKTVAIITTMPAGGDGDKGRVYKVEMPEGFEPVKQVGTYPSIDQIKAAKGLVSDEKGGQQVG